MIDTQSEVPIVKQPSDLKFEGSSCSEDVGTPKKTPRCASRATPLKWQNPTVPFLLHLWSCVY